MFTDIFFTNMSLNVHQPSATVFQQNLFGNIQQRLAWKVINNCYYQWTHPFRIDWAYQYQLFDDYGNLSPIGSLSTNNILNVDNYDININVRANCVSFKKLVRNKIAGVNLLKNKRIIARQRFKCSHSLAFNLSSNMYICADARTQQGEVIHSGNINISLKKIDIFNKKKINIIMQGGQPGALSTPLSFVIK